MDDVTVMLDGNQIFVHAAIAKDMGLSKGQSITDRQFNEIVRSSLDLLREELKALGEERCLH